MATIGEVQDKAKLVDKSKRDSRKHAIHKHELSLKERVGYRNYKAEMDKLSEERARIQTIKSTAKFGEEVAVGLLEPGKPVNIEKLRYAPQTNLSKDQKMLNALFNQKNQLWGNNQPVEINRTLTTGWGLIKTGDGDATRRLFLR